jgi:hypothetical protein
MNPLSFLRGFLLRSALAGAAEHNVTLFSCLQVDREFIAPIIAR